ncbi:MAG: formylglycine-generating enzyme family protein [Myxococcales bacterium]
MLTSLFGGEVRAEEFFLGKTLVTNEEYLAFVKEGGAAPPAWWLRGAPPPGLLRHPVVGVTLDEARQFARWRGGRLPTSSEWEVAARGEAGRRFPWGDGYDPARCVGPEQGSDTTAPVDALPDGATPEGCLQLVGNVWEWTEQDPRHPPPAGQAWVFGGSFRHPCSVNGCLPRTSVTATKGYGYLGFRCAFDPRRPE